MNLASQILILPIRFYKSFVSPFLPSRCRFYPSCSTYAISAIEIHGPVKGLWLGCKRILRCHPFSEGGFDPVPPPAPKNRRANLVREALQDYHG